MNTPKKKPNIWVYIRVSTLEQSSKGYWKDLQLTKIKKYIEYNSDQGYEYDEKLVYKDLWISWAKDDSDRPGLKRLKEDIKDGKVDVVIVYKLDRLARSTLLILEMIEYFKVYNTVFISTNENIETHTATGKFFLTIIGAVGEMDREFIREKTMEGKLEWIKKGFFSAGWTPSYGFTKNKETKKLELVPNESKVVQEIFHLYTKERMWVDTIAKLLTARKELTKADVLGRKRRNPNNIWKWDGTAIRKIITNEAYIWLYWLQKTKNEKYVETKSNGVEKQEVRRVETEKDERIPLLVENTIEADIFHEAQEILKSNQKKFNNRNKNIASYLFSNLIECWVCRSTYKWDKWSTKSSKGEVKYCYRCGKTSWYKHGKNKCDNSQIREEELIRNIFWEINKFFQNPNLIIKKYLKLKNDSHEDKKYIEELKRNEEVIYSNSKKVGALYEEKIEETNPKFKEIISNKIEDYRAKNELLEKRNTEIKDILASHKQIINETREFENYIEEYKGQDIYKLSREQQKSILDKIIKKIVIFKDDVNVVFIFRDTESLDENWNSKKSEISQKWKNSDWTVVNGGLSGVRTRDLRIKSPALYQLS